MCGVNGIFAYHPAAGLPNESELLATREAMRARGPDGSGAWWSADRRCGLGHRRLAILDLSARASQPMVSADGRLVVVFNGEIYNYPALRAELEMEGITFSTSSDTEALLHLYAHHGAHMVHRLRGMFALAIWDEAKRGLFLARDPYGIKPLYTANDGWAFRFASQVKALIGGGAISRDPEPAGIVGFQLFGSVPEPFTLYRDIRALPAGHTQWVDAAGPREPQQFASLAEILAEGGKDPVSIAEMPGRLRSAVLDSVRAHLLADVEVGLFLSAGIDSGAILGLMRDAGQRHVRAITLAFEEFRGTDEDEAPLAAQIARHYEADHRIEYVSEDQFRLDLPAILEAMDQPSIDGVNTWFVAKAAKKAGLKIAISGLGGDELFAGYSSFQDVPRWRRCYGPIASVPAVGALARLLISSLFPGLAQSQPKLAGVLEHANSWAGAYLLKRGLYLPHELTTRLDLDLAREGLRRLRPKQRIAACLKPDPGSDTARVCALESTFYMRNQLLRDSDWAGMAHSLEIRAPLVDIALLKSIAPMIGAVTPGAAKAALARAPSRPLPEMIACRSKTGFGVPTASWMPSSVPGRGAAIAPRQPKGLVTRRWSRFVFSGTVQDGH